MLLLHNVMFAVARHLISFVSLNRGNEVRQMRFCGASPLDYPTDAQPSSDVFSSNESSRSMSCLAFTNTAGKSNPGDRVDMDVSHKQIIVAAHATRAYCYADMSIHNLNVGGDTVTVT